MKSVYRKVASIALGSFALIGSVTHAQETTTYTYDAKGRVVSVARSGGPANGTTTSYAYDPADNRSNVTVGNSPNGAGSSDSGSGATIRTVRYVVVPLNGYTLIKIAN